MTGMFKLVPGRMAVLDGCPVDCPVHEYERQFYANTGAFFRLLTEDGDGYRDSDGRRWTIRSSEGSAS